MPETIETLRCKIEKIEDKLRLLESRMNTLLRTYPLKSITIRSPSPTLMATADGACYELDL
jgi:hypothetical protein